MVGKVLKECVSKGRCPKHERCKHAYSIDYTPSGGRRVRMSILKAFGVLVTSRTAAEATYLGQFIEEVNKAHREGRDPFEKLTQEVNTVGELLRAFVTQFRQQAGELADITDPNLKHRCLIIDHDLGTISLARAQTELFMSDYKKLKLAAVTRSGSEKALGTTNRLLSELRTMFSWARARGFIAKTPFHKHGVKIETTGEVRRERRLVEGEEVLLLNAAKVMDTARYKFAGKRMHLCILGALDTGLRHGEMLRAQVEDVIWKTRATSLLRVPFFKTIEGKRVRNSKYERAVPLPLTPRLYDLLFERKRLGGKAFLFGDAQGHYVEKFVTSWNTLNLLAHGYTSNRSKHHGRSDDDKAALVEIDLHWHDLRHEAISRWAEQGSFDHGLLMQLAGHKNFQTTLRYINAQPGRLQEQMAKFVAATQPATV